MDWFVTLPRPLPTEDLIIEGTIVVIDAETDERLTEFPVQFVRDPAAATGGD